jgi:hypothetical protein
MTPGFLDMKNSRNIARWRWRWHQQSGSRFWVARDLQDLRTEPELEMWRRLEVELRHTPYSKRKVVNMARLRIERARRRA